MRIAIGKVYKVLNDRDDHYQIKNDDGFTYRYDKKYFELVPEPEERGFEVRDEVERMNSSHGGIARGQKCIIERFKHTDKGVRIVIKGMPDKYGHKPENFKLIKIANNRKEEIEDNCDYCKHEDTDVCTNCTVINEGSCNCPAGNPPCSWCTDYSNYFELKNNQKGEIEMSNEKISIRSTVADMYINKKELEVAQAVDCFFGEQLTEKDAILMSKSDLDKLANESMKKQKEAEEKAK